MTDRALLFQPMFNHKQRFPGVKRAWSLMLRKASVLADATSASGKMRTWWPLAEQAGGVARARPSRDRNQDSSLPQNATSLPHPTSPVRCVGRRLDIISFPAPSPCSFTAIAHRPLYIVSAFARCTFVRCASPSPVALPSAQHPSVTSASLHSTYF